MITDLKYMEDSYLFEDNAELIKVDEDEKGSYCVLNSTIFYPQGGGQPTDIGFINIDNGDDIEVNFVSFVDGEVRLYSDVINIKPRNQIVKQFINQNERMKNARSHTAGHLLTILIENETDLIGVKGYHFPNGSYVEFEGNNIDNTEKLIERINQLAIESIKAKKQINVEVISINELSKKCKNIPSYLYSTNKPIRIMTIDGFEPIPCGGTHLKNLSDLSILKVTKIKFKKGKVKISYEFI